MSAQQTENDIDNMVEFEINKDKLFYSMIELFRDIEHFKKYFFSNLHNIDIKWNDLTEPAFFVNEGDKIINLIDKLYEKLDEYANFLFDNTDRMKENEYIEAMNHIKKFKTMLDKNKDKDNIKINLVIAKAATEEKMEKINSKKSNKGISNKKLQKKYSSTPLKYNKIEILLKYFKAKHPDMPVSAFFKFICFSCYGICRVASDKYELSQTIEEMNDITGIDVFFGDDEEEE